MQIENYSTAGGITVSRTRSSVPYQRGLTSLLKRLDTQRGIYLSSGYEFPGRYSRWDVGAVAPPLEIIAQGRDITIRPLSARGGAHAASGAGAGAASALGEFFREDGVLRGELKALPALFSEEERSKQPSAFSVVRALLEEFNHPLASRLALVGAFGYDLLLQFDPIERKLPRNQDVKDLHLFLCDDIYFMDRKKERIERYQYDFRARGSDYAGHRDTPRRTEAGPEG